MTNILTHKFQWLRQYLEEVFLRWHDCYTWQEYRLKNDELVHLTAQTPRKFYHGYSTVVMYDPPGRDWPGLVADAHAWCRENTQGLWRNDCLRVEPNSSIDHNDWEINSLTGFDYMYFAFERESDATWFIMKFVEPQK